MRSRILVDTGPMVAIISHHDQYHQLCVKQLHNLVPPLFTCWPVVTEAAWLLRKEVSAVQRLFSSIEIGVYKLLELDKNAAPWIAKFLLRYHKLGAQVADAGLMYLAERENIDTIFTLDRRDFSVYRLSGNRSLQLLPEP